MTMPNPPVPGAPAPTPNPTPAPTPAPPAPTPAPAHATGPVPTPPVPAPPAPAPTPPAPAADGGAQDMASLPDWAQTAIRDLRTEAAGYRTRAQQSTAEAQTAQAAREAAQEAANTAAAQQQAIQDAVAKALGLKPDDSPPDPAKLTADLQAAQQAAEAARTEAQTALEAANAQQKTAHVKLAVFQSAGQHGGDPAALLDSATFLAAVNALDPSAEGFADQITAAITAAVEGNPRLAAAPAVPAASSTGNPAPAPSARPRSLTEALNRTYRT